MSNTHLLIVLQAFIGACGGFSCVCVAVGWLIKIVKGVKRPKDEIDDKLQRDYDRLNNLDKAMKDLRDTLKYLREGFDVQLENDRVILEHMRTDNCTGEIEEREKAIFNFLKEHQQKTPSP